mmetsp:Transcript_40413/g.72278  ORF Transcript_40413/g.72278 Transcript_40413/m.72278 type:complete len:487 (-) Transcript_40413:209-1669(-)
MSIISLKDLSKLRLGRETLERWISEPELEDIVKGCFVRILVGEKKGERVYRICVVKGVEDKDKDGALAMYKFGEIETNKHLQLEYGNVTKTFKMDYVSNAEFSQDEFNEWLRQMQRTNQAILTSKDVDRKVKRIKAFVLEKRAREAAEKEKEAEAEAEAEGEVQAEEHVPTPDAQVRVKKEAEEIEDVMPDLGVKVPAKKPKLTHFTLEKPNLLPPEDVLAPIDAIPTVDMDADGQEGKEKDEAQWTYGEFYTKCIYLTEKVEQNNQKIRALEELCPMEEQNCRDLARKVAKLEKGDDADIRQEKKDAATAELQKRIMELQHPFEEQRKELLQEIKRKEDLMNQLKIKYRDLRIDHEAIYKDMDKERKDSKGVSQKKERDVHGLQIKIKEVSAKLTGQQTKLAEQQQAIDVQDAVIDELQAQLKEEEQQQIMLQSKRRLQAEALAELTKANKAAQQEIEELKLKHEALESDADLLQAARLGAGVKA